MVARTIADDADANATGSVDEIQEEARRLVEVLRLSDSRKFEELIFNLALSMDEEGKRRLVRSLRSPKNSPGAMKDSPFWPEIDEIIERNRQEELQNA